MKTFFDIESEQTITLLELYDEFIELKKYNPSEYNYSFIEYIGNCLTRNNGTLEIIET